MKDRSGFRPDLADPAENRVSAAVAFGLEQRAVGAPPESTGDAYKGVIALHEDFLADLEEWRVVAFLSPRAWINTGDRASGAHATGAAVEAALLSPFSCSRRKVSRP